MSLQPEHLRDLIMFPLSDVVLFPDTEMPLHIFEPRYREMTELAIHENRPIAMGTLRPDVGPPHLVYDTLGVGFITEQEKLEDGRYVILLEGTARVQFEYELETESPFRTIRATEILDERSDTHALATSLFAIRTVIRSFRTPNSHLADFLQGELETCEDATVFAFRVGGMICSTVEEKLALLRETRPSVRLDFVLGRLSEMMIQADLSMDAN